MATLQAEDQFARTTRQISDAFVEETDVFNNVDMRGYGVYRALKDGESNESSDPFVNEADTFNRLQLNGGTTSAELQKDLDELAEDPAVIREIGRRTKNAEMAKYGEPEVIHVNTHPGTIFWDAENRTWILELPNMKQNGETVTLVFESDTREGTLDQALARFRKPPVEDIRELSEADEIRIKRMAQSGDTAGALVSYLRKRIASSTLDNIKHKINSPKYQKVCDQGVWLVWTSSANFYSLSDKAFPVFLETYRSGKPLTIELCNAAFAAYQQEKRNARHQAIFAPVSQPEPTSVEIQQDLDDLDDTSIKDLYKASLRARASGR